MVPGTPLFVPEIAPSAPSIPRKWLCLQNHKTQCIPHQHQLVVLDQPSISELRIVDSSLGQSYNPRINEQYNCSNQTAQKHWKAVVIKLPVSFIISPNILYMKEGISAHIVRTTRTLRWFTSTMSEVETLAVIRNL